MAMVKPKSTDEYIANETQWQEELIMLRDILNSMELKEQIKWLFPCYTHQGKNVVGLGSFKGYFGLWFFQGALMKDTHRKLVNAQEGKTQAMRQWRMTHKSEIDINLIKTYVQEAINNTKAGKKVKIEKKEILPSTELIEALEKDLVAKSAFEQLTPGRQRDYHDYINNAKRSATKKSRIAKSLGLILQNKGLNDQYIK